MIAILLSGGMDSLAVAWWKKPSIAVTIDYGQRAAKAEIQASKAICKRLDIRHEIINLDCSKLGSGDMSSFPPSALATKSDWWPYRNQLLITLASMRLIDLNLDELLIACVKTDSAHSDGSNQFISSISKLMEIQEGGVKVKAPAIDMTTFELIERSNLPRDLLAWSHSCHKSDVACGNCRGCNKYFEVYSQLNKKL